MGKIFYNLVILSYNFLISFSSLFNEKAEKLVKGRKNSLKSLFSSSFADKSVVWIHCASLGEFEQGRPVIESIRNYFPEYSIVLSFFSPSGYEIRKNYDKADLVFYLPSDTRENAEKLVAHLNPRIVIFVKYEFWYHHIKACHKRNIPVISVSSIFRPQQVFFKSYGTFYRKTLRMFHYFFVQNIETVNLLNSIGITNCSVAGDTRFDRVYEICTHPRSNPQIEKFLDRSKAIILGSTWKPDIDLWKDYINTEPAGIKFIIAPHTIDAENLDYIGKHTGLKTIKYSQMQDTYNADYKVLIIDNIGMLSSLYYYAFVAYVGGSMSEGLHNILEPATYGIPVLIGKSESNRKYQEAIDLLREKGAFETGKKEVIPSLITRFFNNQAFYESTCRISKNYIEKNKGATEKIMKSLTPLLK